jgi:hypothetical protein
MDPVDVSSESEEPERRDDIPEYLRGTEPQRSQFGLKAIFFLTTVCCCYFALERFCNGRAAAVIVGLGLPLLWLFFLAIIIAERVMAWPGLILVAALVCGLVAFGTIVAYRL